LDISNPLKLWVIVLLIYCYIASILPVQYLLQPRDYISAYLLFAGLAFGYVGVIAYHPKLEYPFYAGWSGGIGEILWPALFVTVACGAVSGFHALVASGTTSKQLSTELDAKRIGYGAMVAEGVAAVLAILVVASAYKGSAELGIAVKDGGGPVNAFGYGYGRLTEFFLGRYGRLFAILVLNAFILTTLDTATRICRYITEELFKVKNRYLATLAVVAVSGWLGLSGKWNEIWPLFGAANQLIAALTMIVITSWFLSTHRPIRYIFLPMVFMLITTMGALILKIVEYKKSGSLVLMIISIVLAILAFIIMYEAIYVALKNYRRRYHVKSA
jgi:carbon starvation protein